MIYKVVSDKHSFLSSLSFLPLVDFHVLYVFTATFLFVFFFFLFFCLFFFVLGDILGRSLIRGPADAPCPAQKVSFKAGVRRNASVILLYIRFTQPLEFGISPLHSCHGVNTPVLNASRYLTSLGHSEAYETAFIDRRL